MDPTKPPFFVSVALLGACSAALATDPAPPPSSAPVFAPISAAAPAPVLAQDTAQDPAGTTPGAAERETVGHVRVALIPETTGWSAGAAQLVGLRFELDEHWHLYWAGLNDSGLPIEVEIDADAGLEVTPLPWPAPERLVHEGDLVDHVYHDAVTLLYEVRVAEDAGPAPLTLRARADWLVCREACVQGDAELSLELPVHAAPTADAAPPAHLEAHPEAQLLHETRAALPAPMGEDEHLDVRWTSAGQPVLQREGAARLAFYPAEDGLALTNIVSSCAARGDTLTLELDPDPWWRDEDAPPARLRGIVEAWSAWSPDEGGPSTLSFVDVGQP